VTIVNFDNIRVIEWAPDKTQMSVLYNFAYLTGTGDLTFSQSSLPGGEAWMAKSNEEISISTLKLIP